MSSWFWLLVGLGTTIYAIFQIHEALSTCVVEDPDDQSLVPLGASSKRYWASIVGWGCSAVFGVACAVFAVLDLWGEWSEFSGNAKALAFCLVLFFLSVANIWRVQTSETVSLESFSRNKVVSKQSHPWSYRIELVTCYLLAFIFFCVALFLFVTLL